MNKKENNNNMLSFDKLRSELGIEEDAEVNSASPEQNNKAYTGEGKSVVENGTTFIDITEQFTFNEIPIIKEPDEIQTQEFQEATPVITKKRVKTFNEMLGDFVKFFVPVKDDSGKEKIRKVAMDFSIVLIIVCIIGIVGIFLEQQGVSSSSGSQTASVDKLEDNKYAEAWKKQYAQSSGTVFPTGMNSKFAYLYYVNQDLVGWLKINNTSLDVQIVQSSDNEYYSTRDFYKNSNNSGCPYLHYKNSTQELDDNTVIYGPYMPNNLLFATLDQYRTVEGYKNAPLIEYSTLYETYTFKVFAAFIATDNPASDGGFYFDTTDFVSDAKFSEFINEVKMRSIFNTDISVQTDDKLITLVTDSNEFEGAKLVVMGRMVRNNETADVNMDAVTVNTSPKYPQAWYDNKGNNPFG